MQGSFCGFEQFNSVHRGFTIINIAAYIFASIILWNRVHSPQERMRVREEIEMRIKGIDIFALTRHNNDDPASRYPA